MSCFFCFFVFSWVLLLCEHIYFTTTTERKQPFRHMFCPTVTADHNGNLKFKETPNQDASRAPIGSKWTQNTHNMVFCLFVRLFLQSIYVLQTTFAIFVAGSVVTVTTWTRRVAELLLRHGTNFFLLFVCKEWTIIAGSWGICIRSKKKFTCCIDIDRTTIWSLKNVQ